jgi:hypothetical protein
MSGRYSTEDIFYVVFECCDKRYTSGLEKLSDSRSLVAVPPTDGHVRKELARKQDVGASLGVSQEKRSRGSAMVTRCYDRSIAES